MRYLIISIASLSILVAIIFGKELHSKSKQKTAYQYDYAEINKINYGLFNLQEWKKKALEIFEKKILEFQVSEEAYEDLGVLFNAYINKLYDQYIESGALFDEIYSNLEQSGKINKMFLDLIKNNLSSEVEQLDLRSRIPLLTSQLDEEIRKNEPVLVKYLQDELLRLIMDGTATRYRERRAVIYNKYGFSDSENTLQFLNSEIESLNASIASLIWKTLVALGIAFLIIVLNYKKLPFKEFIFGLTAVSVVLLILGVTLPMIDIDARLNSFLLELMGEKIEFNEQVLYFQSKSILDVTQTLLEGRTWDLKLVGVLIFLFSIVFPFLKLLLSTLYLYWIRITHSKLAQGIIFYLGKWSMADVFTVAMFMAYIGFYGLVTSQLGEIGRNPNGYAVETVNYSKLSPGALFFTSYCILSIITSMIINRNEIKTRKKDILV